MKENKENEKIGHCRWAPLPDELSRFPLFPGPLSSILSLYFFEEDSGFWIERGVLLYSFSWEKISGIDKGRLEGGVCNCGCGCR